MKMHQLLAITASLVVTNLVVSTVVTAQEKNVLEPTQHPDSPDYQSVYPSKIIPLDTNLSWTNRFNGDETFNEDQVLEQVATTNAPASGQVEKNSQHSENLQMELDGTGIVKQIKSGEGKIKLKHGPIDRLGMPGMTMVFKVDDTDWLGDLTKGEEVGFNVDNSSGGFVITRIVSMSSGMSMKQKADSTSDKDATGTIKTIRAEQGKVKIQHGPIERLGMPAMTMMFKLADPGSLIGMKKGDSVHFSVDNSSGGFVITDIEVAE